MKEEVEPRMRKFIPVLNKNFLYRVLAFSLSGTDIVDLKATNSPEPQPKEASLACRFKAEYLTSFLCQIVFNRRKAEVPSTANKATSPHAKAQSPTENIVLSEKFQEEINIQFMKFNVSKLCPFPE